MNRYAEDRLDLSAISDPDLGHHRLHHGLALRQPSITQGPLDVPDEFSEFRGVRNGQLTLRYLLGKFRAPGLERRQLRRELLDAAGTDLLPEPSLLEGVEVAIQRSLGPADLGLHRGKLSFSVRLAPLHDLSPPLDGFLKEVTSGKSWRRLTPNVLELKLRRG
ncbi:MAG: hypothetical protein WEA81_00800, partial [Dehalococcoidia bacterium]